MVLVVIKTFDILELVALRNGQAITLTEIAAELNLNQATAANIIKTASITNTNNPRVNIVTGKDKITKTGLIKAFIAPNTTANTKAVIKLSTTTPANKYAAVMIAKAETTQLIIIDI